ncbi:MAG: hypothetical protein H6R15_1721 [Proteobacteria bacterium]|nr:hypothetical protein [Pseudomonadota bacterium]
MRAMPVPDNSLKRRAPLWAIAVSLLLHGLVLFVPRSNPPGGNPPPRLQASLAPRLPLAQREQPASETPPRKAPQASKKSAAQPRLLTTNKTPRQSWSVAEKQEMNNFLDELATQARTAPKPSLAQRSLSMAREYGREMAEREANDSASLELRPNAPPADPFSLEMYVDGLVKRLNRSAGFVRNDPRSKGVRTAAVQFRLNPDGSLKSFSVLNMGDQAEEIAFIKSVVERSIPFAPFPADINRAARSLAMTICIVPGSAGGGFGFTRTANGRGC